MKSEILRLCLRMALLIPLLFSSCSKNFQKSDLPPDFDGLSFEGEFPLEYASAVKVWEYGLLRGDRVYLLTVLNSDKYLLADKDLELPKNLPPEIEVIRTPVKKVYLAATSAMSLFNAIGSLDSVRFSSLQKNAWFIDEAKNAMDEGKILYAGKYNAPDFELLLKENCSLALESTMIYHSPQIKEKLEDLGIPVFVDKSSYEENPLGRLEWVKIYGLMCGGASRAEEFFDGQISSLISSVRAAERSRESYPSVAFFYINPSGMVIVRGGEDYVSKMIEMAGGKYAFSFDKNNSSPSVAVSMENFYARCADCELLIYNSSIDNTLSSKAELLEKSVLFKDFKAFKSDNIYVTGKNLYQATDKIGEMILDLRAAIYGEEREMKFLEKIE